MRNGLKLVMIVKMILFRLLTTHFRIIGLGALCMAFIVDPGALGVGSSAKAASNKRHAKKSAEEEGAAKDQSSKMGGTVATFGAWSVSVSTSKPKTCYALAKPIRREPSQLKRNDAYIFISTRPGDNVRNEVAIKMGYDLKEKLEPKADVGSSVFELVPYGENAFAKNPAQDVAFIEAMKKAGKLVVKGTSKRGKTSTDTYALTGLSDALARVQKECR